MRLPVGGFKFHKMGDPWLSWHYLAANGHQILTATEQHVILTLASVALGVAVSVPLAALARRTRWLRAAVLGLCSGLYAVPSLAFVVVLFKVFGLSRLTIVVPLAAYTLVILVRNILTGLDEVDAEAVEAARGMGLSDTQIFWRVRLPIAVPTIVAGLRLAVVSTIELVVIGGYVGQGGYGALIFQGFNNHYRTEITTYILLTIALALVADALILTLQRRITPWRRGLATP